MVKVNGAKFEFEFHPNTKLRRVHKTIFFSDQGGSWHCLNTSAAGLQVLRSSLGCRDWVALGMLMHFALTMLWRLAKAGSGRG